MVSLARHRMVALEGRRGFHANFQENFKEKTSNRTSKKPTSIRKHLQERVMRHMISGLVAAVAVMAAAPAMACGFNPCGQPAVYVALPPPYSYSGCNPCGGCAHERLADPEQQYYYVNQGPTYTGPGDWAPRRTYQEGYVSGSAYRYDGGYRARPYYRPWRAHTPRYGYAPRAHA